MSIRRGYETGQTTVPCVEDGNSTADVGDSVVSLFADIEVAISNIHSHKERLLRVSRSIGTIPTPIEKEMERGEVSCEPANFFMRVRNTRNFVRTVSDEIGYLVERLEDSFQ